MTPSRTSRRCCFPCIWVLTAAIFVATDQFNFVNSFSPSTSSHSSKKKSSCWGVVTTIPSNKKLDIGTTASSLSFPRSRISYPSSSSSLCRRQMFTGIVEEMGTVVSLEERNDMPLWDGNVGKGTELTVEGKVAMDGAYLGCSICVNGVCLTATELNTEHNHFKVGLAPETLRRTYLGTLKPGTKVNLERASEIGGRNSGHFVQGHVDGVGTIIDRWIDDNSLFYKVRVEEDMLRYIVPKGFVAVDGTSLTVCDVDSTKGEMWFTFMLVEYTQKKIIIPQKTVGDLLNIEVDVLGKYSENALSTLLPRIEQLEAKVQQLEEQLREKEGQ